MSKNTKCKFEFYKYVSKLWILEISDFLTVPNIKYWFLKFYNKYSSIRFPSCPVTPVTIISYLSDIFFFISMASSTVLTFDIWFLNLDFILLNLSNGNKFI
jgi:hypothetical protein